MASGTPGTIAGVSAVISTLPQGGNSVAASATSASTVAASAAAARAAAGKLSPQTGNAAPSTAAPAAAANVDPQSLVDQANKYLNDSGLPDQFRVDPDSGKY